MKTQICTKCFKEKKLTTDNFESQTPGQFNKECRVCRNEYHKGWRDEKAKEDPFYTHKKALRELYKTTKEWFDYKLEKQQGHCALCPATNQSDSGKRLSVDHNHNCCPGKRACGKCNRGLLCFNCNKKLGMLEIFMREALVIPKAGTLKTLGNPETWTSLALQYLTQYAAE